jgi:branched-chain amino acid transport system substrate-binding protein
MNRMKGIAHFGMMLGIFWTAQLSVAQAADDVVFGFAVAQTGGFAAYDDNGTKMAQLFMEQVNAKGGLLGKKIRAVFADTKSDRTEGAKAGQQVISEGAKLVFVTCDYDYGAPAALQAQRAGAISVFLCAEDPKAGIVGVGKDSFSASGAAQIQGAVMATWSYKDRGFHKGYVLMDDAFEYPKSVCAGFDWAFPKLGGEIVGRDSFKTMDASIASQVTRLANAIRDKQVEVVMFCADTRAGPSAIKQIREAGITLPIVNASAMDGEYWLPAVPNLGNFYVPVQAAVVGDPRPDVNALTKAYSDKFGGLPATQYAYPIYAFLQLWEKAVTQAGTTDAAPVVAKLEQFKNEPTILGPRSFSATLHMQDHFSMMIEELTDGKWKVVGEVPSLEPIPTNVLYRKKVE